MISDEGKALSTAEQFELTGSFQLITGFGVSHLTIKQTAELVVLDMWFSGEIPDIEAPEAWNQL